MVFSLHSTCVHLTVPCPVCQDCGRPVRAKSRVPTLSACQAQGLAPAARVLVQGNQWLCGGVPRGVLPLLGPLNGTFLAFPCFASPTLLPLAANASAATLSANNRVQVTVLP